MKNISFFTNHKYNKALKPWVRSAENKEQLAARKDATNTIIGCIKSGSDKLDLSGRLLTSAPSNLNKIIPNLSEFDISHNRIESLPDDFCELRNLKKVNLEFNPIKSFPKSIVKLPSSTEIFIDGNALPEKTIENLRETLKDSGPTISYNLAENRKAEYFKTPITRNSPKSLEEAVDIWNPHNKTKTCSDSCSTDTFSGWNEFKDEFGASEFLIFLNRLQDTAQYKYNSIQFQQNVSNSLAAIKKYPELRWHCFAIASESITTCLDKIALGYIQIESAISLHKLENEPTGNPKDIIESAKQQFRMDKINKIAATKVSEMRFCDEVEVYLAYVTQLKKKGLDLLGNTTEMEYPKMAGVNEQDIDDAYLSIKEAEAGHEFTNFLSSSFKPWQNYLRANHKQEFDDIEEMFDKRISNLNKTQSQHSKTSHENECNEIEKDKHTAIDNLHTKLTQEYFTT